MARRNQNTFLKRQKEMERVRKAKEKMARRQGKVLTEEVPSWAARVNAPAPDPDGAAATEPEGAAAAEESSQEPGGEGEPEA
jgi:hypothetical protein